MSDDLEILTQAWDAVVLVLGRHTDPGIRRPLARASANIEIASRAIRSTPGSRGAAPLPPKESSATMTASTTTPGDTGFLPDGTRTHMQGVFRLPAAVEAAVVAQIGGEA